MRTENLRVRTFSSTFAGMIVMAVFPMLLAGWARPAFAQASATRTFSSAGEACHALFQAAQKSDERELEAILGTEKEVISSGDEIEDKLDREQFSKKYQEMHRLVQEADGSTVLYIGAENWPFPIPLASKNGEWYFDSDRGKQEILFRRIGENEATAIQVCQEFALAKNAAHSKADSEDPITKFAESLASGAAANADNKDSNLFHGYYFRIEGQNLASAVSSRRNSSKGLTLVAYPAEYQSSGIKTFVVTQRGTVFEKDLGRQTTTDASKKKVRPGSGWHLAI